ncbi:MULTISPECIES: WYL domain-containing protein [unclassified Nodularia (in: cyanobacteria)]|uniref:WYL domain-containing protein n=1 Tax=unclassified Nodularia (in: cyanobacteria) TaxID=2656917 RepID=UPI00188155A2|nr:MULTISPECIES: WYL domain-containing protein [unclassified Nodularia (in: cyanobacteria)]MBE9198016.1 WYL domain-containing protein [Nodularia sp. LEGE 06071]MCC2691678.1 WYL domain-containing protein [Nodularia sp. LEGE 04288]
MSRKGQSITLSISERDKAELEAIALQFGMMWGDRPNISKLVEAIAQRQLLIGNNNDWTEARIRALHRCIGALTDIGQVEQAQIIANLLLERSELSIPLRNEIESFLENLPPPWRLQIDNYIQRQHPFQLSYQDPAGRIFNFTVRYAQVAPHEKRQYLDCWCEETEGNFDIPELIHNWCLRLDRITDAAVISIPGEWRSHLDEVEVEMHIFGGLAFGYKAKLEDNVNEWLPDKPKVRRVIRRVSSTFWFNREVMQYAPDCVVIMPENVRDRLKQKLLTLCHLYDIETMS